MPAWLACLVMAVPQLAVAGLLIAWSRPLHGTAVLMGCFVGSQLLC